MTSSSHLERALPAILEDVGRGPAPDYADGILTRTASIAQRPAWTFPGRWLPWDMGAGEAVADARLPWRIMVGVALIALVLAAGAAVYVGGQPARLPAITRLPAAAGPGGNGLIAYDHDGDIYVGDPVTGTTTAIVTGPTNDSGPVFAPDGMHIAFLRRDESGEMNVVVVLPDGSDERDITPVEISRHGIDIIAWTPDSARVVVDQNHWVLGNAMPGFDGQLAVLDASGVALPRQLTPPLPAMPGGPYFVTNAGVAPMFRPPNGDRILSGDYDALNVFDADLRGATQPARRSLMKFEPYGVDFPAWSPDGSKIAFNLRRADAIRGTWGGGLGLFVVDADGSALRRIGDGGEAEWSPDGSRIAFHGRTGPTRGDIGIGIVDVESGTERALEATHTDGVARAPRVDLRGWSWSPDGLSIMILEERQGPVRPLVVDVETGAATELPWMSDSLPSWQRVPVD